MHYGPDEQVLKTYYSLEQDGWLLQCLHDDSVENGTKAISFEGCKIDVTLLFYSLMK